MTSVSYGFEAAPKVVKEKTKYRSDAEKEASRIVNELLNDKNLKKSTPRDLEKEYITRMSAKLKEENLNIQLINFKNQKKKKKLHVNKNQIKNPHQLNDLYDIKPLPNPQINVDLQFFLTERNEFAHEKMNAETITDIFKDRPPPPPYVPKKVGINVFTQIEDGDLFNFDIEVEPILKVIVSKTLEQSRLEIEQQQEIENMQRYKQEYEERRKNQNSDKEKILDKELKCIQLKDRTLEELRRRENERIRVQRKVQNVIIAKNFLSKIQSQAFDRLEAHGYYNPEFYIQRDTKLLNWIVGESQKKVNMSENYLNGFQEKFKEIVPELCQLRKPILEKISKIKEKKQKKKINLSKNQRLLRVYYYEKEFSATFFSRYLDKMLEGSLENYLEETHSKKSEIENKYTEGSITNEEYQQQKNQLDAEGTGLYTRLLLNNFNKLSFGLANNPLSEIPNERKKFKPSVLVFDKQGNFKEEIIETSSSSGIKIKQNFIRDKDYHYFDEFVTKLNLLKLTQDDISTILLCVELGKVDNLNALVSDIPYSFCRCYDTYSQQCLDLHYITENIKIEELQGLIQASKAGNQTGQDNNNDSEENQINNGFFVAFAIRRELNSSGWRFESIKCTTFYDEKNKKQLISKIEEFLIGEYKKIKEIEEKLKEAELQKIEEEKQRKREEEKEKEKARLQQRGGKLDPKKQPIVEEPPPEQTKKEESIDEGITARSIAGPKFDCRCLGPILFNFDEGMSSALAKIEDVVKEQHPALSEATQYGWKLLIKGKEIRKLSHLKKVEKIEDLQYVLIPRPPTPPPPPKSNAEEGEEDENNMEENESDG